MRKQASQQPLRLLAREWSGRPAAILLDGAARGDADRLDQITTGVRPTFRGW